jgi:hypothetical protein
LTGIKVYVDNSDSLAWGILRVLKNPRIADRIRGNGFGKLLGEYDWNAIAERTLRIYDLALMATVKPSTVRLKFPFLMFEDFPEDTRILLLMHILGAVDRENAKRPAQLAELLGISIARLHGLLQKLLDSGYLACYRDDLRRLRYFLTKQGIVRVCTAFS